MPRRGNVPKREVLPDPLYNSVLVTKLVNSIMLDGKKGVAQKVVYSAFDIIKEKTDKDPLEVFTAALENIMPSLDLQGRHVVTQEVFTAALENNKPSREVKAPRVGGAT